MDQQNNCDEKQQKETLLKTEILDKGYDSEAFINFMEQQKENGGQDIDMWTYTHYQFQIQNLCDFSIKSNMIIIWKQQVFKKLVINKLNQLYQELTLAIASFQQMNQPQQDQQLQNISFGKQSDIDDKKLSNVEQDEQNLKKEQSQSSLLNELSQEKDIKSNFSKIHLCKAQDKKELLLSNEINVQITKYQRIPGGIFTSSYYSYTVQTDPIGWNVQRRYSDFLWLRELLCKVYPGINIAPLPKKTVLKNEKDLYLQKRMKFLEKFLKSIFNCELLRHDKWFNAFLSSKEEKEFKQIQKLSAQVQKVTKLEQIISIDGKIQLEINDILNTYNLEATSLVNSVDISYKKLRRDSKQLLLDFDQLSNTIFNMGSTCAELYQLSNKFNQSIPQGKISQLDILYILMIQKTNQFKYLSDIKIFNFNELFYNLIYDFNLEIEYNQLETKFQISKDNFQFNNINEQYASIMGQQFNILNQDSVGRTMLFFQISSSFSFSIKRIYEIKRTCIIRV